MDRVLTPRHRSLLTKLLPAIATALGYETEQLVVLEGECAPVGWEKLEEQQGALRRGPVVLPQDDDPLPPHESCRSTPRGRSKTERLREAPLRDTRAECR
jgi:hypothetical protein